jgi:hypothetical protein
MVRMLWTYGRVRPNEPKRARLDPESQGRLYDARPPRRPQATPAGRPRNPDEEADDDERGQACPAIEVRITQP